MSEQAQAPQQHFEIQKVYLKDVSLEMPNSPMIFTEQWHPQNLHHLRVGLGCGQGQGHGGFLCAPAGDGISPPASAQRFAPSCTR
jgi:hypothetical protein